MTEKRKKKPLRWKRWKALGLPIHKDERGTIIWRWTDFQLKKACYIKREIDSLEKYYPLTIRQIYYRLVSKQLIHNTGSEYTQLSKLLKWARIDGLIPWECMEDRTRVYHNLIGFLNTDEFIEQEMNKFLEGYARNLMQSQKEYIEIWVEKDALSTLFVRVADKFCISVVVCKGFASISFLRDYRQRISRIGDKTPVILHFGDFDPSGNNMLPAIERTLNHEMEVSVECVRVALTYEDAKDLPYNPNAFKAKDTRAQKHFKSYGKLSVELDALEPKVLEDKIKKAIVSRLDITAYNAEVEKYNGGLDILSELKKKVQKHMNKGGKR